MPATTATRRRREPIPPALPVLAGLIPALGMTNVHLADKVGCTADTVTKIIRGTLQPSQALMEKIAKALGVTDVDALFALDPQLQRLVDQARAAGINTSDDTVADRLVVVLSAATARR